MQTFTFEEEKFALMEDEEEHEEGNLMKPFECELCKKQFTKIEILKRHIKTHMKEKVCTQCFLSKSDLLITRSLNALIARKHLIEEMC